MILRKGISIAGHEMTDRISHRDWCGYFRDHVTNLGVSRRETRTSFPDGGNDSQQSLSVVFLSLAPVAVLALPAGDKRQR